MLKTNPIITIIKLLFAITGFTALIAGIASSIINKEFAGGYFSILLIAALAFVILLVPDFIKNKDLFIMPMSIQLAFAIFTFFAMFLGEVLDFYERFPFWDTMLHFVSGIMFSIIGYMIFISINRDNNIRRQLNPVVIVLFTICFSITCGTIWEIIEFAGDSLFGTDMQVWKTPLSVEEWVAMQNTSNASNPGLVNTMKDIVSDTLGSLLSIVVILPLAKHKSRYKNSNVSTSELLDEYNESFSNLQKGFVSSLGRMNLKKETVYRINNS